MDKEQVYCFISGKGKMLIDDVEYPVTTCDAVHFPPTCKHQGINDTKDDIGYLNIRVFVEE